jgi:hypothetical protein
VSPTARSLAFLRERGALPAVVERWNPGARVRQDLYGFLDLVAIPLDGTGLLGVQACVTDDQSKRLAKILAEPVAERARRWLENGNRILVHGWAKRGPRGKRKLWTCSETEIYLAGDGSLTALTSHGARDVGADELATVADQEGT